MHSTCRTRKSNLIGFFPLFHVAVNHKQKMLNNKVDWGDFSIIIIALREIILKHGSENK